MNNVKLKDELKTFITVGLRDYTSINEVLKADYKKYKETGSGFNMATYRDKLLLLDIEDCNEDVSAYEFVKRQVDNINEMLDGE